MAISLVVSLSHYYHFTPIVILLCYPHPHFTLNINLGKTQPCALACKPEKKGWYSELAPQVIDGTRCYDDGESLHVCIRGKCHVSPKFQSGDLVPGSLTDFLGRRLQSGFG